MGKIFEEKMKDVVFFVEANSFEQFTLWKEYHQVLKKNNEVELWHKIHPWSGEYNYDNLKKMEEGVLDIAYPDVEVEVIWERDDNGDWVTIGYIDNDINKPICVSFTFVKLYGKLICFYNATSRYVDNILIEEYIKNNYPVKYDNETRIAITDAQNFHHALHLCKGLYE